MLRNRSDTDNLQAPRVRLSIALTLIGIILIGVCSFLGYNELSFYTRSWKTQGVVTNRWGEGYAGGEDTFSVWHVEIQFVNEKTGKQITVYADREPFNIGLNVPILYDPDNPTIFRIDRREGLLEAYHMMLIGIPLIFGVPLLVLGARAVYLIRSGKVVPVS